jgi:hypothetical protein
MPRDIEWYEYEYELKNGAQVKVLREITFYDLDPGEV